MRKALIALLCVFAAGCGKDKQTSAAAGLEPTGPQASGSNKTAGGIDPLLRAKWTGDLDGMSKRRLIRALVYPSRLQYFFDGAQPRGIVAESAQAFEQFLNERLKTGKEPISVVVVPVRGDDLVTALVDGRGDMIIGLMTVTADRAREIAFTVPAGDNFDKVILSGPSSPSLSSIDDLAGKELYYRTSHSFHQDLLKINERFKKAGKPPMTLRAADENLQDDDIYEMVNAGLIPLTVGERHVAELWAQVFDNLKVRTDLVVKDGDHVAWAVRKDSPRLLEVANEFVQGHRLGTPFGNTLLRRYLKEASWVKNARSSEEQAKFQSVVRFFQKYGSQYELDYMLIAAQGYQESGLDQSKRNPSGAVGVMQIKPDIAAAPPIGIRDIHILENNIHAGVKYVRHIADEYYKDEPMDQTNRMLFALASYNAGPSRIQKVRAKAAEQGLDPNKWFESVDIVASQEIGRETVQYVSNIYKYYVTYKLIEADRGKEKTTKGRVAGEANR